MNIIYRKYKERDLPYLVDLIAQLGYEHTEKSLSENIHSVKTAGGEIFVAEMDEVICGFISAIIDTRLAEGVSGEIVSLVVSKSVRGKGVGKHLVSLAETWLKPRVPSITIRANTLREGAHSFYEKQGYHRSKTQVVFKKSV